MISPKAISWFVIAVTALLIGFDIYLAADGLEGNTYSERIINWGRDHRWLPFLVIAGLGAVTGHWFMRDGRASWALWCAENWHYIAIYGGVFIAASVVAGRYW